MVSVRSWLCSKAPATGPLFSGMNLAYILLPIVFNNLPRSTHYFSELFSSLQVFRRKFCSYFSSLQCSLRATPISPSLLGYLIPLMNNATHEVIFLSVSFLLSLS